MRGARRRTSRRRRAALASRASPATRNRHVAAVRSFGRYCKSTRILGMMTTSSCSVEPTSTTTSAASRSRASSGCGNARTSTYANARCGGCSARPPPAPTRSCACTSRTSTSPTNASARARVAFVKGLAVSGRAVSAGQGRRRAPAAHRDRRVPCAGRQARLSVGHRGRPGGAVIAVFAGARRPRGARCARRPSGARATFAQTTCVCSCGSACAQQKSPVGHRNALVAASSSTRKAAASRVWRMTSSSVSSLSDSSPT